MDIHTVENALAAVDLLLATGESLQDQGRWTDPDEWREIRAEVEALKADFRRQRELMRGELRTLAEQLAALSGVMTRILAELPSRPDSAPFE